MRKSLCRRTASCFVALAVLGCRNAENSAGDPKTAGRNDWLEARDSSTVLQLSLDGSVCRTCIRIDRVADLGKGDGPDAFVQYSFRVYRDADARYWVGQGSEIKLFDSAGRYLRKVGAPGSGPGEWRSPWFATDAAGKIRIVDASNARITELDSRFRVDKESPLPGLQINSIAPNGPNSFVTNAWAVASDMIGEPIHVFRDGKIVKSFGGSRVGVLDDLTSQRLVSADGRGHVFLAKPFAYEIEAWTETGERIIGASGPALNRQPVKRGAYDFDRNPLPSEIRGIRSDSLGRLWVLTSHVKEDWRTKFEQRVFPGGQKTLAPKPGTSARAYRFSRIEVIDMATARIIAQLDVPQVLVGFAGPDELWENTTADDDTPVIAIWRVRFAGQGQ